MLSIFKRILKISLTQHAVEDITGYRIKCRNM